MLPLQPVVLHEDRLAGRASSALRPPVGAADDELTELHNSQLVRAILEELWRYGEYSSLETLEHLQKRNRWRHVTKAEVNRACAAARLHLSEQACNAEIVLAGLPDIHNTAPENLRCCPPTSYSDAQLLLEAAASQQQPFSSGSPTSTEEVEVRSPQTPPMPQDTLVPCPDPCESAGRRQSWEGSTNWGQGGAEGASQCADPGNGDGQPVVLDASGCRVKRKSKKAQQAEQVKQVEQQAAFETLSQAQQEAVRIAQEQLAYSQCTPILMQELSASQLSQRLKQREAPAPAPEAAPALAADAPADADAGDVNERACTPPAQMEPVIFPDGRLDEPPQWGPAPLVPTPMPGGALSAAMGGGLGGGLGGAMPDGSMPDGSVPSGFMGPQGFVAMPQWQPGICPGEVHVHVHVRSDQDSAAVAAAAQQQCFDAMMSGGMYQWQPGMCPGEVHVHVHVHSDQDSAAVAAAQQQQCFDAMYGGMRSPGTCAGAARGMPAGGMSFPSVPPFMSPYMNPDMGAAAVSSDEHTTSAASTHPEPHIQGAVLADPSAFGDSEENEDEVMPRGDDESPRGAATRAPTTPPPTLPRHATLPGEAMAEITDVDPAFAARMSKAFASKKKLALNTAAARQQADNSPGQGVSPDQMAQAQQLQEMHQAQWHALHQHLAQQGEGQHQESEALQMQQMQQAQWIALNEHRGDGPQQQQPAPQPGSQKEQDTSEQIEQAKEARKQLERQRRASAQRKRRRLSRTKKEAAAEKKRVIAAEAAATVSSDATATALWRRRFGTPPTRADFVAASAAAAAAAGTAEAEKAAARAAKQFRIANDWREARQRASAIADKACAAKEAKVAAVQGECAARAAFDAVDSQEPIQKERESDPTYLAAGP